MNLKHLFVSFLSRMFRVTAVTWKNLESWAIKSAVEANIKKQTYWTYKKGRIPVAYLVTFSNIYVKTKTKDIHINMDFNKDT